jgi:excisionase family DNA binding protein
MNDAQDDRGPLAFERPYLSFLETCKYLGLSQNNTRRHMNSGALPARKLGGKTLIMRADIDAFIESLPTYAAPGPRASTRNKEMTS